MDQQPNNHSSTGWRADYDYSQIKKEKLTEKLVGRRNPLLISLIITAVCFSLIGGVGWEVSEVLRNQIVDGGEIPTFYQSIGFFCVFIPIIASFFLYRKPLSKMNPLLLAGMIIMFCAGQIIGFSMVFLVYNVPRDWLFVFGVAGAIFLVCALVGFFCPWINMLWKYVAVVSVIWFIGMIILLIVRFAIPSSLLQDIHLIMAGVFGLLTMFYIMFDVNRLKNYQGGDAKQDLNFILYMSFRLIYDVIMLVWVVARLFIGGRR